MVVIKTLVLFRTQKRDEEKRPSKNLDVLTIREFFFYKIGKPLSKNFQPQTLGDFDVVPKREGKWGEGVGGSFGVKIGNEPKEP